MKEYDSLFAPNTQVGVEAYITELLIQNRVNWYMKKKKNVSQPKCAFWKNEIADQFPEFKELQRCYILDISYVKNLLKCFSAPVIISYIKEKGLVTFRGIKKDKQQITIYNLFIAECKYQKEVKEQEKQNKKMIEDLASNSSTNSVTTRKTRKTKLTNL